MRACSGLSTPCMSMQSLAILMQGCRQAGFRHAQSSETIRLLSCTIRQMKLPRALIGAAGTYYVAARLAHKGLNAAITVGNAPGVDILASLPKGNAAVAIQVKTSAWAWRKRSRTSDTPHDYDWAVGKKLALTNEPNLIVALVDLKDPEQNGKISELPDVYIVRSTQIY